MILTLLMKQPQRVFSRQQIMESVTDEPAASMERAIDTHIKTLRAKLHAIAPDEDPIQTHRGLGYSLQGSPS